MSFDTIIAVHSVSWRVAISLFTFLLDRVQREQLTAIFRLMKENSETFGEMTEGDMKEQLKLYDM